MRRSKASSKWRKLQNQSLRARRKLTRRLAIQELEGRQMLAVAVNNVGLVDDTGPSNSDWVTGNPTLTGTVNGDFWGGSVDVQFDLNADDVADAALSVASPGDSFIYDPRDTNSSLANYEGPITVRYRPVEYDGEGGLVETGSWSELTITLYQPAPEISLFADGSEISQYATVSFDPTPVGTSVSKSLSIANTGEAYLNVDTWLSLPYGFTLVSSPSSVSPGSPTTFTIQLDASYAGSYGGSVSLGNNDSDENPFDFYLDGTVTAPEIRITSWNNEWQEELYDGSSWTDLGTTGVGSPLTRTFTVENTGNAVLSLESWFSLPHGFTLVTSPSPSVSPGSSTYFTIQMDASFAGSFSGYFSVGNNDGDENPFDFYVYGTVQAAPEPEIDVSFDSGSVSVGAMLNFGSTTVGQPLRWTFTIHNLGNADLVLDTAIQIPDGFVLDSPPDAVIGVCASTTFTIRLAVAQPGTFSGWVSLGNNDSDENPFDFSISAIVTEGGTGGNHSPPEVANPIDDFSVEAEQVSSVFDLSQVFADVDVEAGSDSSTYTAASSDETLVTASTEGDWLTLSYLPGQLGTATITLRATDSHNAYVETSFAVTVVPFNHAPTATALPAISVDEDAADVVLSLWDYFDDVEDADDQLTLDIAVGPDSYWSPFDAVIDPATGQLTLSFPADASGQVDYVVSATDTGGKTVQATLSVTVHEVNDAPTGPADVVALTLLDAAQETIVDLWDYFTDVEDGSDMTYEIIDSSFTNRTMFNGTPTIDADDFLRLTASVGGTSQMTIRATDSSGASVTGTFEFRTAPPTLSIVDKKHTGETASAPGYFEVKLTGTPTGIVEVPFQLTAALNASAAAGLPVANYIVTLSNAGLYDAATQSGVLRFDGVNLITLSIAVPDDADKEGVTNVSLALSSGANYNAGTMSETLQIYDDDSGAVVYIAHVKHTREGAAESDYGQFMLESIGDRIPFEWCYLNSGATCDAAPADAVFLVWDSVNGMVPWTSYPTVTSYDVRYEISGSGADAPANGIYSVTMGPGQSKTIPIVPLADDGNDVDDEVILNLLPNPGPFGIVQSADGDHLGCFQSGSYALGAPDNGTLSIKDSDCACACDDTGNFATDEFATVPIVFVGAAVAYPVAHGKFEFQFTQHKRMQATEAYGPDVTIEFWPNESDAKFNLCQGMSIKLIQIVRMRVSGTDYDGWGSPMFKIRTIAKGEVGEGWWVDIDTANVHDYKNITPYYDDWVEQKYKGQHGYWGDLPTKPAIINDYPGAGSTLDDSLISNMTYEFETVAVDVRSQRVLGSLRWAFSYQKLTKDPWFNVVQGAVTPHNDASATFYSAIRLFDAKYGGGAFLPIGPF